MGRSKQKIDWERHNSSEDNYKRILTKFRLYLQEKGIRDSTIETYEGNVKRYLSFVQTDHPTKEDYARFRESLHGWKLSRSTLNQYGYAAKAYHEMIGEQLKFRRIAPNNHIPYYFTGDDVDRIFSAINNIKHLAMLKMLFYGCLRASELCHLDDEDVDIKSLTLRINGKCGQEGMAYINNECANTLREYLEVRPMHLVDGRQPLFYTDYGQRWRRMDLYCMFTIYKKKAGIEKHGGVHVFGRHTPATLMIARGCDIRIVQKLLRHKDIRTPGASIITIAICRFFLSIMLDHCAK